LRWPAGHRTGIEETNAMTTLSEAARRAIEAPRLAHLTTLNPDGSPQVTLVWAGLDGDEIVIAHMLPHRKVRNVRNDPRVAVSFEAEGRTNGMDNYLVVYGRARITEGGAADLLQRLAESYIGPGVKFPPMENPPPGYLTRITVERVAGVGPWASS
jgi:PPOX class probable F420-dependent enzyme